LPEGEKGVLTEKLAEIISHLLIVEIIKYSDRLARSSSKPLLFTEQKKQL